MICYIATIIFILYKSSFLNESSIKITIFWFFGWALVMIVNSIKIGREKGYLKRIIIEIIGLTAIISYISNFYSLPLLFELIIIPVMFLSVGMAAVALNEPKNKKAGECANMMTTVIMVTIFVYSLCKTIINFKGFTTINILREFLTPVILSLAFIPFMYILSIYSKREQKITRERVLAKNSRKKHSSGF
jgi:peptidoglycan/LPS O-acetylase OafA/YrhL